MASRASADNVPVYAFGSHSQGPFCMTCTDLWTEVTLKNVGLAAATIVFALYAAVTTEFADGGADAASGMGEESLCTRREIENSRF